MARTVGKQIPRMLDVARRAGVSQTTVSFVLNERARMASAVPHDHGTHQH